jgi:hypothetical protein
MSYNWARGCIAYFLKDPNSLDNESMKDLKRFDFADKKAVDIVKNSPLLKEPKNHMLFFYKLNTVYDPGVGKIRGRVNRNNKKGVNYLGNFRSIIDAYKAAITKGYNYFYYYPNREVYGFNGKKILKGSCWTERRSTGGWGPFFRRFRNVTRCPGKVTVYAINPWVLFLICKRIWYAYRANNAYLGINERFENKNELKTVNNNLLVLMILIIIILVIYFILKK